MGTLTVKPSELFQFDLLAEGEVIAVGMAGSDTGAEAQCRQIASTGNFDVEVGRLYIQLAGFYFRTEHEGGVVNVRFGGQGCQYIFRAEGGDVEVHLGFAVQFQELFQLQFVVLQGGLCGHQLVLVGAYLRFQLCQVALGDASCFKKLAGAFAFGLAHFQGRFVHFHGFGGVEYLHVGLCDAFFDAVLALCYAKLGNAVVKLLLLDGVEAFAAVVEGPVGVDAVAAVVGSFALTAGDVVAVNDGVCLALRAIYDTLAHTGRKAGEESGSGGLYIYLGTFRTEAVLADGDVLLQGIVDARLQVPLGGQAVGWLLGTAGYLRGSAVLGGHSHTACHT